MKFWEGLGNIVLFLVLVAVVAAFAYAPLITWQVWGVHALVFKLSCWIQGSVIGLTGVVKLIQAINNNA